MLFFQNFSLGQILRRRINWVGLFLHAPTDKRFCKLVSKLFLVSQKSAPVVIDIGANVGNFVRACVAQRDRPTRLIAIEPSTYVYTILSFWTKFLWSKSVQMSTHKIALSNSSGYVTLKTPVKASGSLRNGLATIGHISDGEVLEEFVETMTLDSLLTRERVKVVDIVKMDVEGAETLVIEGAENLLKKIRPVWYVECHDTSEAGRENTSEVIFKKFINSGYRAYVFDENLELDEVTRPGPNGYVFVPD